MVYSVDKWNGYPVGTVYQPSATTDPNKGIQLLVCGASTYPDNIKYKEISTAALYVFCYPRTAVWAYTPKISSSVLNEPFVEDNVTYSSLSIGASFDSKGLYNSDYSDHWFRLTPNYYYNPSSWPCCTLYLAIRNGVTLRSDFDFNTPKSANKPYFELVYGGDNIGVSVKQSYPTGSATISKSIPTVFSWETAALSKYTLEPVEAASAVLRWRYLGSSTYTEVACDNPLQCTIPSNTFTEGTIQWQVVVTANSGIATTSEWMTTEVKEPVSSAVASYPTNTVLDGAAAQTFMWEHIISNGTEQYAFDLQTSPNGSTWSTIRSVTTKQTNTTFAPGTFAAGNLWWRVRTYNAVGTAGTWSEPANCIVIAAPEAPSITADDNSPRFVLRWQQTGQQAYELMVDGVIIAKTFSAESIYRHDGYLEPGIHKVQVRIQNRYQMWSEWGTATLQIVNTEGDAVQLSAVGENEVELRWNTSGNYDSYIVYRNGEKIAEAATTFYTDHFAVGEVTYQVRGVHTANGNYTLSNAVPVTITPQTLLIADVTAPEWIKLPLSTASLRSAGLSTSQTVTYTHYIGTGLPGAEIGEAVSRSYDLDCAFKATDLESIRCFESLLGKMVCIKTPSQRRIVGVLAQMTARENRFHVSYRAPIVEVRWEEMNV